MRCGESGGRCGEARGGRRKWGLEVVRGVGGELGGVEAGESHRSDGRLRLRRTETDLPGDVDERFGDVHSPSQQIDSAPTEPEHLTESQPAEPAEHDKGAIAGIDAVGKRQQFGGRRGEGGGGGERGGGEQLDDPMNGGGSEVRPVGRAQTRNPGTQGGPIQLADRGRGRGRACVLGRRVVTVGHHRSHHSPTVMRPSRGSMRTPWRRSTSTRSTSASASASRLNCRDRCSPSTVR